MIIDRNHPKFTTHVLVDERGYPIEMIKSYNTETGEAELYLYYNHKGHSGMMGIMDCGEWVIARAVFKNAKLVERHKVRSQL